MAKNLNKLYLQGKLVNKISIADNLLLAEIFVNNNNEPAFIRVMFKGKKVSLLDDYALEDYINITAHLRSALVDKSGRKLRENRYIADEVNEVVSIANAISVENESSQILTFSEFCVSGEVIQLSKAGNKTYVLAKVDLSNKNFVYYISMCAFSNLDISVGKVYVFSGYIQTWIEKKEKRTVRAENVITNVKNIK